MAGKGSGNFNELLRPIEADPIRAERLAAEHAEAVSEQVAYSLNQIRERLGVTQAEMASTLGISQPAVSKALHGVSTIAALQRLVEAFGGQLEITVIHLGERYLIDA